MLQSMRFLAGISCVPMLCLALTPSFASAQDKADEAVPLKKLVLFNSGVGYFEHSGNVEGDASVDLKFNVDDVNDLLKSMVTQDLGGGRISTVIYGSRDTITRTLKTFSIDLTTSPTIDELLVQIRGEKVEVESPNKVTGTILGVERRKRKVDDDVVEYDVLNLVTATGLKSVSLEQVSSIKLLNEKLDAELRQALLILATGNSTDKKTVSLKFLGEGKRPVRIGYIQETPVWKTSYRHVLSDEGQPQLQGWAIVENQTESDWSNVNSFPGDRFCSAWICISLCTSADQRLCPNCLPRCSLACTTRTWPPTTRNSKRWTRSVRRRMPERVYWPTLLARDGHLANHAPQRGSMQIANEL
jgi:hypothetical protein